MRRVDAGNTATGSDSPEFRGNPRDLEEFLLVARSAIRSPERADAINRWDRYKVGRQLATLSGLITKGSHIRARSQRVIDLTGADLEGITLGSVDLRGVIFDQCSLRGAWLKGVNLENASFVGADLSAASPTRGAARLLHANLQGADFTRANLAGVDMSHAVMIGARLVEADLTGASLCHATLTGATVEGARLVDSRVYGVSAWDLVGTPALETGLLIAPEGSSGLSVDHLKVAQFVYLLLQNADLRLVLDTLSTRTVLILGRFTPREKAVLDEIKVRLRARGFVPILFDFEPSQRRDLIETVRVLAGIAYFVVADLTDAKAVPEELGAIVPELPSVPVQVILRAGSTPYTTFGRFARMPWVLPHLEYSAETPDLDALVERTVAQVAEFECTHPFVRTPVTGAATGRPDAT